MDHVINYISFGNQTSHYAVYKAKCATTTSQKPRSLTIRSSGDIIIMQSLFVMFCLYLVLSALINSAVVFGWHDFPIQNQDRPPDPWLSRQIDSLSFICMQKFQPIFVNFKETVYHYTRMKINCLQICSRLYTYPQDDVKTKYSVAPCGSIILYTPYTTPISHEWIISVNQQYRINSTFVQLDMIHNDPVCQHNHVQLEDYNYNFRLPSGLVKICGRSYMKVFYSRVFSVKLKANIVHLNQTFNQVLHYKYQIYSQASVSELAVRVEGSETPFFRRILMSALFYRIRVKVKLIPRLEST